ncbi:tRNA (guanosine(37)-N1)-methyltransferase TrmD [Desulfovibrio sulfodismutans]|uniref:tRNA (guanine-N(1)-)-methyltransferase n=1 Tax=Desulfolutivibrio sulfodismutans TaxID=63561 RepID=A0A7K3NN73_9BACT|nr:tRNA (guanosine(37)-N1)-methyltransferase TrmD [Desulfolutivibrio sulfodismutans]NDY57638.1 tRNA (guanosine(37)-N1)-methyltransferase TrmD [Desulfolutivibrio sulfodismutans]QLA14059.1 tRNA (guanosine(37)-N1)-methyltransferase TrmD [Desulfolutivibrio sulfodismutans DSM 3696]
MTFHIVTLFPEFFREALACGLMGKAMEAGLVAFDFVNPRDFAVDRHHTVDDRPYGGGPGMVMMPGPLVQALASISAPGPMVLLTPGGRPFDQKAARRLADAPDLTLVCGRYEGIDARLAQLFPLEPVSVGDFVINGGETAALCVIEAVARLLPGFMGKDESAEEESFSSGLLEYPHYTRPEVFDGLAVPPILLSGDHARIAAWRREQSLEATLAVRPGLLPEAGLTARDVDYLRGKKGPGLGRNLYTALLHGPVLNRQGKTGTTSLTNLDVHDIARVSRSYGLGGYFVVTPLSDQRALAEKLVSHWTSGPGLAANPDRADALSLVRVRCDLHEVEDEIASQRGMRPFVAATSAKAEGDAGFTGFGRLREILCERPVLLVFGTGSGLAPEATCLADGFLPPIRPLDAYNHLSVRSAAAILVDRLLGDVY